MPATAAKLEVATSVITKAELLELADAEADYSKYTKKLADAKREVETRRQELAEKVLGIKSSDELKALDPNQVLKLFEKRWEKELWKLGPGAPEFSFVESSHGRYPAWAQLFVDEMGQTAAARIKLETPESHSYRVAVTLP